MNSQSGSHTRYSSQEQASIQRHCYSHCNLQLAVKTKPTRQPSWRVLSLSLVEDWTSLAYWNNQPPLFDKTCGNESKLIRPACAKGVPFLPPKLAMADVQSMPPKANAS
jgi:hypothetical protein